MNLISLKMATKLNAFKQVDASTLSDLRSLSKEVKLLPSSANYDWFTSYNDADSLVCNGEVITLGRARYANIKYYKGDFVSSNNVIIQSINETQIRTKYLYYFLQKTKKDYYVEGTTYPKFDQDSFDKKHLPLYSIDIQDEIIAYLDSINNCINNKITELNQLDELIKSRFIELFGDAIQNEKHWPIKKLNDITDVRDGTHDSPKYYDKGYPFVTSKNLIDGKIDFSTCQLICEEDYLHFNDRSKVDDGDILMPMIGTIGGAIIVKKDRDFSIKNVALIKFNKDNSIVNRKFILNILNSDAMNSYFDNTKKGGTQKFIALGVIRDIPIIMPPIELQNIFASFVELIDKSKFSVQKEIELYQELLDKKMDEYFG